jgi:biotin carboxyl carrier protein
MEAGRTAGPTGPPAMKYEVQLDSPAGKKKHTIDLEKQGASYAVLLDGKPVEADVMLVSPNTVSVILGGTVFEIHISNTPDGNLKLQTGALEFQAEVRDPRAWRGKHAGGTEAEGRQQIVAPMPGKVIRLLVKPGDQVQAGQGLLVVEAMKMQNEIRSPKTGKVERLQAKEGQAVNAGDVLAWVD